jgi:hypothetical protein
MSIPAKPDYLNRANPVGGGIMKQLILVVTFALACTAFGVEQQVIVPSAHEPEYSLGYVHQGADLTGGGNWFGMNGARADVMVPVRRHWSVVAEFAGVNAGSMSSSGAGLTLFTLTAGPRFSYPLRRGREMGKVTPFTQMLFGGVHAIEGAFPSGATVRSMANSFAMSLGGGVEVGINRRASVRLIQAEYLYTHLPNLFDNYQNNYRIGAGVVLRLH